MKKEIVILAAAAAISLAGCSAAETMVHTEAGTSSVSAGQLSADAVSAAFTDDAIAINGSGCEADGTALTITQSGTYVLTGSCSNGSVKVKKGVSGVTLILNGLDLTNESGAAIVCGKNSVVTIEAAAGTENALHDTEQNNNETYPENENAENAVIRCKDGSQVVLCGSGSLTIYANGKNGIKSDSTDSESGQEAFLTIRELNLTIEAAANDAVNAEQLLQVESGTLHLSSPSKALHCDRVINIGAEGTDGPQITIDTSYEGLEAAEIYIASGELEITSTDDCLNAANSELSGADYLIEISGGVIRAYTSGGDGFDSNGNIVISGGDVEVWSANTADNQPLDADGTVSVTGGTVLAAGGSGGMGVRVSAEQAYVTFGSTGGAKGAMKGGSGGHGQNEMQPGSDEMQPRGEKPQGDAQMQKPGEPPQNGEEKQAPAMPDGGDANAAIAADSEFTLTAADGTVLYSGTARCGLNYVFYSAPELADGESYTLAADGSEQQAQAQTGTQESAEATRR